MPTAYTEKDSYTTVLNNCIMDNRLKNKDLGCLVRLLRLPPTWKFTKEGLYMIMKSHDGKEVVNNSIKKLEKLNYIYIAGEMFGESKWVIRSTPTAKEEAIALGYLDAPKEERKIPTLKEVKAYCNERKSTIDADKFYKYYESKNWYVKDQPMKDWKKCVITWEKRQIEYNKPVEKRLEYKLDYKNDINRNYTKEQIEEMYTPIEEWEV